MRALRCWPLIERELRAQSRLARSYWLRWGGVYGLALGTWAYFRPLTYRTIVSRPGTGGVELMNTAHLGWQDRWALAFEGFENQGDLLLASMNTLVLCFVWVVAPLLTADCLSSERRNGTLGLLLLTPMRAGEVVAAKWAVHGWQVVWTCLAAMPLLVVPVLAGGVSWADGLRIGLVDGSAMLLALTAGLLASSLWDGQRAVLLGAAGIGVALGALLLAAWSIAVGACVWLQAGVPTSRLEVVALIWTQFTSAWGDLIHMIGNTRRGLLVGGRIPGVTPAGLIPAAAGFAVSLGVAVAAWGFVVGRVRLSVQQVRVTATVVSGNKRSGRERPLSRLRRGMLEAVRTRNPFLWVELRTWRGQAVPGLCVGLVVPWMAWRAMTPADWGMDSALGGPVWLLAGVMSLAAASCLHDEHTSGSIELLLTVPDGARRLLAGKFTGLVLQVLPAVILVVGVGSAMLRLAWVGEWEPADDVRLPAALALAVVGRLALAGTAGAWCGLWFRGLIPACVASMLILVVIARGAAALFAWASGPGREGMGAGALALALVGAVEAALAVGFGLGTLRVLRSRAERPASGGFSPGR